MRPTPEFAALCLLLAAQLALHASAAGAYVFSDELNYMGYGERIHAGQVIYRDFFEGHAPGNALIAALLYSLPDPFFWARLLVGLAQAAITLLIFIIGLRVSGKPGGICAALLYVLWEPMFGGMWFVAEPFVSLLFTAAMLCAVFWPKREWAAGLFAWGLFAGAALVFKLKAGWFAAASAILIAWRGFARTQPGIAAFAAGLAAPWALLAAWLLVQGAAAGAFRDLVLFNITEKAYGDAGVFLLGEFELFALAIFILSAAAALAVRPPSGKDRTGLLLWGWFAAGLLMSFPRFNLFRAAVALPPLALILADSLAGRGRGGLARGIALIAVFLSAEVAAYMYAAMLGLA